MDNLGAIIVRVVGITYKTTLSAQSLIMDIVDFPTAKHSLRMAFQTLA